ncbi:MAG: uncharacterized protein JWQ87_970 [Candidatus Sulfotelmatobacter sp.]|nr:uncharacterized protein [Candidatus Sulfotelmatobacter sp.]
MKSAMPSPRQGEALHSPYVCLQRHPVRFEASPNVPNGLRERELPSGEKTIECVYTPHSLRATAAATLLLDAGVDIMEVKELLGHRHVTTTQIYDKRRRAAREGASHKMPL